MVFGLKIFLRDMPRGPVMGYVCLLHFYAFTSLPLKNCNILHGQKSRTRADDTADETKKMSVKILNYRDFTMETETIGVYQLCSLRLLIHRGQTFRPRESHFPGLRSRCGFRTYF